MSNYELGIACSRDLSYHDTNETIWRRRRKIVKETVNATLNGYEVETPQERGFLVGVELKRFGSHSNSGRSHTRRNGPRFSIEDSLEELAALADTAGMEVVGGTFPRLEHINPAGLLFSSELWQILMALGFFLIWNAYGDRLAGKFSPWILKGLGWALLIFLSITYSGRGNGAGEWMHLYWWGILGLIGWGYLAGALAYLLLGDRPGWITFVFFVFMLLNINEFITPFSFRVKLVVSASNHALVLAGVVVTSVMIRLRELERIKLLVPFLLLFSALLFLFGFITRPLWGISKILATPSWTAICAAITALVFMLMYLLTDRLSLYRWAGIIKAAGTSTLTCYLVPYFVYALRDLSGLTLPSVLTTGFAGILKSLVFAILIIQITGILERLKIRLKI